MYRDNPEPMLTFYTPKRRKVCRQLKAAHPEIWLDDWFSGYETLIHFPASLFPVVAEAVGVFQKRKLSPEAKQACIERLAKARKNPVD